MLTFVTFGLRRVFVVLFVLGTLLAVSLFVSQEVVGREEPIEGAGRLAAAGSEGINGVPGAPEAVERQEDAGVDKAIATDASYVMTASYYGQEFAGSPTASGEPFDPEGYTAAHKSLPLGTKLLVEHGGESVEVVVNDRGPYIAGRDLDLSEAAARELGLIGPGEGQVNVAEL